MPESLGYWKGQDIGKMTREELHEVIKGLEQMFLQREKDNQQILNLWSDLLKK